MAPTILYTACVVGAIALYLMLRPGPIQMRGVGILLGLGVVGWLFKASIDVAAAGEPGPNVFFYVFSLIAVACAVRMITHPRPIYSALYFVMVVMSTAALFLLLGAEFMAFALVIVYAGAILITYLFVIMLAQQAPRADAPDALPEYDRLPREPAAAVVVGLVMLALLGDMIFAPTAKPTPQPVEAARLEAWRELEQMPQRFDSEVLAVEPQFNLPPASVQLDADGGFVMGTIGDDSQVVRVDLPDEALPENVQRVGWALVHEFPVSLELAGVILLMAMFGAVVLAQRQIELSEEEKRAAAKLVAQAATRSAQDSGGGP